jgi:ribosomal protein S18 acetylase RimI-like enzyme
MRRALERAERSDRSLLLAASQEGRIVGFGRAGHHLPPADSPPDAAPSGWYLLGVIVAPEFRRRGMAFELTRARLAWTAPRCETAYYFVNARNRASIDLHARFGFVERTRRFSFPGVAFQGGVGVLFEKRFMREGPKP